MRRASVLGLLVVLLAGVSVGAGVGACSSSSGPPPGPTSTTLSGPPPALPQAVEDTVLELVTRVGGADHATARYAYGTRRQALRVLHMGDLPPNQVDSKVFVVVADGSFTLPDAKVRKGAPTPNGSHLVVVVDPDEPGSALDVGVSRTLPPLEAVGQVAQVDIGPAPSSPTRFSPTTIAPATRAAPS